MQLHKLETALNWHLQHGTLQDASVLQLLVVQAAADGNAAMLSLLLPLFEKMGWLVSAFPRHTPDAACHSFGCTLPMLCLTWSAFA